jgi:microcin C transport system ATP-binding protein
MPEPAPLLSVRDLSTDFVKNGRRFEIVRNISFDLAHGETLGIVGESGSGKSVTALSIARLLPQGETEHPSGSVLLDGVDLLKASPDALQHIRGRRIGMIFQEPMSSLNPILTVEEQIVEVLSAHRRIDRRAASARALELLNLVGIPEPARRLHSYPFELSGGQAQRVMIAIAIANDPDLLIADEPTTALDVTVQAQVLNLLAELQRRFGMGLLLITHDLRIVEKFADRVCVMNAGEIVEEGKASTLFRAPTHPYTQKLLAAQPTGEPPAATPDAPLVVEARGLRVRFPLRTGLLRRVTGHVEAVAGVDLAIRAGQTVAVVGESGSGKTTLGRAVLRLIASEGTVTFEGRPIDGLTREAMRPLRRAMQVVFQDPIGALSPRMRVADIVAEGLRIHGIGASPAEREAMVCDALVEVGLDPETRRRYPHEFSGGQRQRIAIARVIVLKPRFIVLDEPTSALDRSVQAQIVDLLRGLQREHGIAYLFISHDLAVVKVLASDIVVMRSGVVVESGPATEIFARPRHPYTQALFKAAFDLEASPADAACSETGRDFTQSFPERPLAIGRN